MMVRDPSRSHRVKGFLSLRSGLALCGALLVVFVLARHLCLFRSDSRLRGVQVDRAANAGLTRFLARVTGSLHQIYTLGFAPGDPDRKTHTIEVQVTRPGLTGRARQGYMD